MHQSMTNIFGSLWCLCVVLGCLMGIGGMGMAKGDLVVVKPQLTDELLANPVMGWQTFDHTSRQDKNLPDWIPSTVNYARWGWGSCSAA
ncbi:MAG: hypothetical protein WCS42_10535 [Verrucomicrobiota bacterium]